MPWSPAPCRPHRGRGSTSVAESLACEPVWDFARRHPDLGVRVYRTAAGLRVLVTGAAAAPSSDRARELLTELASDPLYVELCATHDSYRARLTPKPFRVGEVALPVRWPFVDEAAKERYEEWVSEYDGRSSGHAVCRLISASGPEPGPGRAAARGPARRAVPGGGAAAPGLRAGIGTLRSPGATRTAPLARCRRRVAEDGGFEPPRVLSQHDFQSCALGHYANPPRVRLLEGEPRPEIVTPGAARCHDRAMGNAQDPPDAGRGNQPWTGPWPPARGRHRAGPTRRRRGAGRHRLRAAHPGQVGARGCRVPGGRSAGCCSWPGPPGSSRSG